MLKPPFRIAVDTGGTFTDVVLSGAAGDLRAAKAPTTPERAFEAIEEALGQIGREEGLAADQLLAGTSLFIYGTTRATNAILTGSTSPTAFFTSAGFPDILTLREGGKTNPFDFTLEPRKPFVPRHLTFEIPGRIDSSGAEVVPLDEEAVLDAIGRFAERDVRDVGVCFLWSIANPAHELRVGELLRAHAPDLPFTLSHQFNPILREYRRASSTCLNASLRPLMEEHLRDVKIDLETAGFEGELLVVTSTGGCISIAEAAEKPLYCANSGPSLAPVAARVVAAELLLDEDLVVCDAGGTSFDVSLVREGKIGTTRETWLGEPFVGQMTGLSSAEVTSIGAGGGSIAWVDDGGLLRIGPESAGSVPGPVCYRRGGTMPTVTDAACVLGYLNPGGFLDGRMQLDVEAAGQAIREGIGDPLGLDLDSAAHAIIEVASEAMASAIREATINQGVDPRECTIVLGGGAGPTFGGLLLKAVEARRAVIPATAGTLSASGAHVSDIRKELVLHLPMSTDAFDLDAVVDATSRLQSEASEFLVGLPRDFIVGDSISWSVDARYPSQAWEIEVPLNDLAIADLDPALIEGRFDDEHERRFAVNEPGQSVECQSWKATAVAELERARLTIDSSAEAGAGPSPGSREMYFKGHGRLEVAAITGAELAIDEPMNGPGVVEVPGTTIVVSAGTALRRTVEGHFLLESTSDREGG